MGDKGAIKVSVVGSGYVGTVAAACLSSLGREVVAVEIDGPRLASLRSGRVPFFEAGLEQLVSAGLESGNLRFTGDTCDALNASDVVFLCVETPSRSDGTPDMSSVERAAAAIATGTDGHHVVVTKSTVPIGSGRWLQNLLEDAGRSLRVVSNPEFLREGCAVADFLHPDRVVLGSDDPEALDLVEEVYRPILEQSFVPVGRGDPRPLIRTGLATAETVKYAANAFLATKISFINEIAQICNLVGADVDEVATALGLDTRIGSHFLEAGIGWGGSCFGKDLAALTAIAQDLGYDPELLRATVSVNTRQRNSIVERLKKDLHGLRGRRLALLGLAFKPGTDDLRDSPALGVAGRLLASGAMVSAYDPLVRQTQLAGLRVAPGPYEAAVRADAVVLVTEWPEFLELDFARLRQTMRGDLLLDARNMFDPRTVTDAGLRYEGIGRRAPGVLAGTLVDR
jgi:UDPglucose 6-dehydrogenase